MEPEPDVVIMRKGKVMVRRHGDWHPLDMILPLSNGARVAMDGTLTMPDGTTRLLMDGEAMTLDGEMTTVEDLKEGNLDNNNENPR
jgi:hypothetical protein